MSRRVAVLLSSLAFVVATASTAVAQSNVTPIGLRGYFTFDTNVMSASKTFDAVVGTHDFKAPGAGAEIIRIWKGAFVRFAGSKFDAAGSRVVVYNDDVASLDIPLTLELRYVEFGGGWRFGDRLDARYVPYAGGGLVKLGYRETSDLAGTVDNVDTTFNGANVFAGVDVLVWRWLSAGAEVQYRSFANAIGEGGASKAFGENNLGGTTFRVMIGARR